MNCGFLSLATVTAAFQYFLYSNAVDGQQDRQTVAFTDESPPPSAWYQLPLNNQSPLSVFSTDQSVYGPRQGDRLNSSFIPVPSPFQLPKPQTPQELTASQIVNAAQERKQNDFFMSEETEREHEREDFDLLPYADDPQLYWRRSTRRNHPSRLTTESPLKQILSREITNLERYLPLLGRHRSVPPIFSPPPTSTTRLGKRRRLLTTTPTTTTDLIHMQKTRTDFINNFKKCHNCKEDEDEELELEPATAAPESTHRRKTQKKVEPCQLRKLKTTTQRPAMPTLKVVTSSTTLIPFIDYTDKPPTSTHWPYKSFAKWTKFTLSSRVVDPLLRKTATLQPLVVATETLPAETTTKLIAEPVLIGSSRLTRPWTHQEHKPEVEQSKGKMSPIELAIVWFVDHLRSKTTASTELIEAVKDALARFRSTLNHNRAASPPLDSNEKSSLGGELELTWKELTKGTWLESAFSELVFSDSDGQSREGAPDTEAAARKVDELWQEAMLASALSTVQDPDTDGPIDESLQPRLFQQPVYDQNSQLVRKRFRDSPETKESETALNCRTFPMLCSILQALKSNNQSSGTITTTTPKSLSKSQTLGKLTRF